jgi:hypothetical protein
MKERVAGARGQSADRNYIGQLRGGVNGLGGGGGGGRAINLPKSGGWRVGLPVFGGSGWAELRIFGEIDVFSLVRGLQHE